MNELARRARDEMAHYRRNEPHDDRYAFELFHRTLVEGERVGWQVIVELYEDQLQAWCSWASGRDGQRAEDLAARTWERFWRSYTPAKLAHAGGLAGILRYLKLCAGSVAIDAARERHTLESLEYLSVDPGDSAPSPADMAIRGAAREAFWQIIEGQLTDERERVVVSLRYTWGYRPAEIQTQRPDLFPTVQEVYRVTRNVLDRFRRCDELRRWQENYLSA
jgi:DNA-directed RNA polymerase specialized sigma24 family protein